MDKLLRSGRTKNQERDRLTLCYGIHCNARRGVKSSKEFLVLLLNHPILKDGGKAHFKYSFLLKCEVTYFSRIVICSVAASCSLTTDNCP